MKYIWILGIALMAIGCHSMQSVTSVQEYPCPQMTFEIDSLPSAEGMRYFVMITYSNLSGYSVNFYRKGRISVSDVSIKAYLFPGWHVYLRNYVDINSSVSLEPNKVVVDSLTIPTELFLQMKGKEILLGRSGDQKVKRNSIKNEVYLPEQICPMLSINSVFVPK